MWIVFKNKTRLGSNFHFKDWIPKDLIFSVLCKFQCGLYYYDKWVRHLNVRIGEHVGISPFTKQQCKPKNSSATDYVLFCTHSTSYDDFSILKRENKVAARTKIDL